MLTTYHRVITTQALSEFFSAQALEIVISANLGQDHWLRGQIGHPEYHFDQNAFLKSKNYMEQNRALILPALQAGDVVSAQQAFGRLTHAAQDFYAHSNYVTRWLGRFPPGHWPPPDQVDPLDSDLLNGPELRSGKIYWPLEPLSWIPRIGRWIIPLLPPDSHARMNLDSPDSGPAFPYAIAAAVKRTRYEYELTVSRLPDGLLALSDMGQPADSRPAGHVAQTQEV
jgi:hypothetical protein